MIQEWSTTPASNATGVTSVIWSEGQLPSTVNNSARQVMADVAAWRDAFRGVKVSAGTADAQTLTTGLSLTAYTDMPLIAFEAGAGLTNTTTCTMTIDSIGGGAKTIKRVDGSNLLAGDITAGGIYLLAYESTAGVLILINPTPGSLTSFVDTANSPNANEFARFTDANTIEGRTVAETRSDLGLGTADSPQFTAIELNNASANTLTASGGHMTIEGATVWDSGNDGTGSGLDADLLDGKDTGTSGNVIPLLDGANTWSGAQSYSVAPRPSSDDAVAVGVSGTAFSDLFLASGALIDFAAGNYTFTHSSGLVTASGNFSIGTSNVLTAGTIELGHASANTLSASGGVLSIESVALAKTTQVWGQQTIWVPAAAMVARTTNGAASGSLETGTNDVMAKYLAFDSSTSEGAQISIQMPKGWNEGTIIAQFIWTHPATASNFGVTWGIRAVSLANDDALDTAFGSAVEVSDTGGTTSDVYITSETSAVTVAGSPAAEEFVVFEFYRDPSDGGDSMGVDAYLLGVKIHYTTDAAIDD